jgi:hypothetical protein
MISRRTKFLSAAVGAGFMIASLAFSLTVHNGTSADPAYGAHSVVAPDGRLIGVAPNPSTRSHLNELFDAE